MPGKKSAKTQQSGTNITVKGNVTGNIVVGNENAVGQPKPQTGLPHNWVIAVAVIFLVLVVSLFATWKVFFPSILVDNVIPQSVASTSTPVPLGVWKIELFDNINLNGSPLSTFTQSADANTEGGYQVSIQPQVLSQQVSAMPASNYSLRLVGTFEFQQGYFEFHCEHHDGCRIYVDGINWIDAWWDGGGGNDLARDLSAGKHVVVIEFYDKSGYGLLEVRWRVKP